MYPGWSSWFAGEGVTPDNVKLVSYPAGPSGTSWGAIYSGAFVFNPTLSEAELKAAIKYVDFVWSGYDRWVGLGEYRVETAVPPSPFPAIPTLTGCPMPVISLPTGLRA